MPTDFIIGTSVVIQLITVLFALRLIKITGRVGAWIFISAALVIMEGRRVVSFLESVGHNPSYHSDFSFELLGLLTSLLMLIGVVLISPLFKTLKQSEETQKELIHKLETTLAQSQEAEQLLEENRHFIERIIDTTPNLLYIYDLAAQRNVFANREVSEFLGFSKNEVMRMGPAFLPSIVHPDDIGRINDHHKAFAKAKDTDIFEIEYRVKDYAGQWRWLLSREVVFSRSPDGLVREMLGIAEDISNHKHANEALRESETKLRTLFDYANDTIFMLDFEGNFIDINKVAYERLGYTKEEMLPLHISHIESPRFAHKFPNRLEQIRRYGHAIFESEHIRKDGTLMPVEVNARLINLGGNKSMISVIRDITSRKNAEETLQRAYGELETRVQERTAELSEANTALKEEKYRIKITNSLLKLFVQKISLKEYLDAVVNVLQEWSNCSYVGIRILDENGTIPYESLRVITENAGPPDLSAITEYGSFHCNDIPEYLQGLTEAGQAVCRSVCVLDGFKSVALIPVRYQEKVLGAIHLADEKEGKVPSAKVLFAETLAPLIGESMYKFNAEENLRKSQDQLRNLTAYLQKVRENERTIVAREIHDELGQIMTALKIDLSWIRDKYQDHEGLAKKAGAMLSLIDATIQTVKKIITNLRPGILDHLGISAAIEWQAGEFQKTAGISCDVDIIPEEINLNKDLTTNLFRIFQEILTNIMRHSEATHISVLLTESDGSVVLNVKDNGKGITEEQISRPSSFGIMGIRERVHYMGGSFYITGSPLKGTEITVIIPVGNDNDHGYLF